MLIIHRCVDCGHPDYWDFNSNREGSLIAGGTVEGQRAPDARMERTKCHVPQCCRKCRWGQPEIADHYQAGMFGVLVTHLVEPGALANGASHPGSRFFTCNCDDCKVFYVGALASAQSDAEARNAAGQPTMPEQARALASVDVGAPADGPDDGEDWQVAPIYAGQAAFEQEDEF